MHKCYMIRGRNIEKVFRMFKTSLNSILIQRCLGWKLLLIVKSR